MFLSENLARVISAASFLFYGFHCLVAPSAVQEFKRYGVPQFRRLVGLLELVGAAGLMAGLFVPWLTTAAAGGLTVLMMCGVGVRLRISDPLPAILPALGLLCLNLFIFLRSV